MDTNVALYSHSTRAVGKAVVNNEAGDVSAHLRRERVLFVF